MCISEVKDVLNDLPPPCLLLNFDETVFSKRPDKSKRKTVSDCINCNITSYWKKDSLIHYISIVACISAECKSLNQMILSTRAKMDKEIDTYFLAQIGKLLKNKKKGYMT